MKKSLLCLFLALVLVLGGCTKPPAESATAPTAAPATTVPASTAAPTPENQELTRVIETDGSIISLSGTDSLLAVTLIDSDDSSHIVSVDPVTGLQLGEADLADPYADLMAFSDGVATFSWDTNTLTVFSPAMELVWSRTLTDGQYGNLQSDECLYLFPGDSTVVRQSLSDQSEQVIPIPEGLTPLDIFQCLDNRSLLRCSGPSDESFDYLWLDWTAGTAQFTNLQEDDYFSRTKFYNMVPGADCAWLRSLESETYYRIPGNQSWAILSTPDTILTEAQTNLLTLYDLEHNTVSQLATSGVTGATICGQWVAYVELVAPGQVTLWNTELGSGAHINDGSIQRVTAEELAAANEKLAQAITEDTGMPVFIGVDGTDYNHGTGSGYTSQPVTDPLTIYRGLEQLQLLTDAYPDGMFREMCTEAFQPIEVYLSGPIHGDMYGFDPIGFTTYTGDAQIVVLDIAEAYDPASLRATIAHEFMHVMENRISEHGMETGMDYLTYWMSFVPDPDMYFYDYNEYLDYDNSPDDHTANSGLATEDIYFLDSYSRTMPTEDRARILEHLYLGSGSAYSLYLQDGVLKEKAQYLCAVIRECFPSCQIEGRLPWEQNVEIVPFSQYEEAVRTYVPEAVG